jgi:hypothetical protein
VFVPHKMLLGLSRKRPWTGSDMRREKRNIYRSLFGKRQGKRPLGRTRLRLERKLKMIKIKAKFVRLARHAGEQRCRSTHL